AIDQICYLEENNNYIRYGNLGVRLREGDTEIWIGGIVVHQTADAFRKWALEEKPLSLLDMTIKPLDMTTKSPVTVLSLVEQAILFARESKYSNAEPLFQRALSICEPIDPTTVILLSYLADTYREQEKYEQAEPLYQRALSICEQHLGAEHPDMATSLNNLA